MDKTAIKNFAIWARRKLISEITYKAGTIGINDKEILKPLPISTANVQFFDIGTSKPAEISNDEIKQRNGLINRINEKESISDYQTAFQFVIEEVAYTWFNRLIAIRFMEVNDYLPSRIRVLSSEIQGKAEPDMVTTPFDTDMEFSSYETDRIMQLKDENKLDELFRMLFIKQCNKLNDALPELFEKTADYTELLLNISFTDKDGIVSHLVNDIEEEDFTEAVEIIGWMYQYYNEERKNEVINIYKGTIKKDDIPAATQLFTTDWVVRYMVDNSLGRYWIERNPQSKLREKLEFFVAPKNGDIQYIDEKVTPEEMTFFDPCMGSGHILVYAFDVLMEIYRESGYVDRDAAQSIVKNNIFGLDIDDRAYQLAYFAVMMKARSYDRRMLTREITPSVYPIYDYSEITISENEELQYLIDEFKDIKQYGSLVNLNPDLNLENVKGYLKTIQGQLSIDTVNITQINNVISIVEILMGKYTVVCTNPPYLNKMNGDLKKYINKHYKAYSGDLFSVFMYKNFDYCEPNGYCAFMTPFVWMFIKMYENLREYIITNKSIITLVQMEYSAFEEATVPICAFILKNGAEKEKGLYIRLSDFKGGMEVQKEKTLDGIKNRKCDYFYETSASNIAKIPSFPISYWSTDTVYNIFMDKETINDYFTVRNGITTGENEKFIRYWYEVDKNKNSKWVPCNKGGSYRKWSGNRELVIDWEENGYRLKNFKDGNGRKKATLRSIEYNFQEAITMSRITSSKKSYRWLDEGFITEGASNNIYFDDQSKHKAKILLAILNSVVGEYLLSLYNQTINVMPEEIRKFPLILSDNEEYVEKLVDDNIKISKANWDFFENSWEFKTHPLIEKHFRVDTGKNNSKLIKECFKIVQGDFEKQFIQLKNNEEELNRYIIESYGLQEELSYKVKDQDVSLSKIDLKGSIKSFVCYAVGCVFGRYSLDEEGLVYAGGDWNDNQYTTFIPDKDNCIPITDEEYFEDDIVGLFVAFVKKVYGAETLEENLDFIARALGNKGDTSREVVRNYFIKDFYKDHVKIYKKRPIYWLYDSGKQDGFKALIYMHRYNADTTGTVRVDYLHEMQKIYTGEIDRMQDMVENSTQAREIAQAEKRKEKLVKQLKETKEYDEKIAHIALSRIDIDLDDGVKVNYDKVQTGQDGKKLAILAKI